MTIKPNSPTNDNSNPDSPWHGKPGGYTRHGCRCDRCREAIRLYKNGWRVRNPTKDVEYKRAKEAREREEWVEDAEIREFRRSKDHNTSIAQSRADRITVKNRRNRLGALELEEMPLIEK